MPKKKGIFDTGTLMRAGQRGVGIAAGTVGGELVEEKLPIQNNKIKGLLLFTVGAYASEFYNDNPILGGLGAGVCSVGVRTALKDNLQFLAGPIGQEQYTIPEDYEVDDYDLLSDEEIEGVVEEIDDEVVEGVTEEIDDEVVEGVSDDIDDEVLEGDIEVIDPEEDEDF